MKRKIISLLLALIIAFGTMPLSTVFAVDTTSVVVTADKTSAYPGDTVLFTVSVGTVNHLMGAEFVLSIPSGMTYTLNSAAVAEGLAGKVGFVSADWTESTMKFTAYGDGDYSTADLTDFLTFSCKIDDNTLGEITPQITDVVLSDTNFEEISTSVNTDGAVVIVSAAPVSVTGVTLNKNTLSLYTGESETLTANLIPANSANKTVSWKSDDTSVATVDDNGKVTAIKKGSTIVTVTTADGGFTDTCTVDVACSHSNKTVHPAVASTCLVGGNGEYTTCDDCGEVISGSSAQLPLGDHNYIENVQSKYLLSAAQCNKKAVYYKSCSVCGVASTTDTFEHGEVDPNNHIGTTYIKNQKEATCYEEGYTGDTYCSGCDSKLSSGTVIGKNAHNPASVWSTDENYHWHNCQTVGCGNLIDKAVHIGGEATCINKAICSVCNVEYGVLDTNNHKNTKVINAKAATCCEDGYTGDTYCNDCNTIISSGTVILASGKHTDADGKWETNGTNHWHTCYYGTKFDLTAHSGGTATCKDKAVCSVCGTSYGELDASNHAGGTEIRDKVSNTCCEDGYAGDTYCLGCNTKILSGTVILASGNHTDTDGKWETDGTNHWHTCYYGTKFDLTSHSGGTATCKDKAVCSVCGSSYGEVDLNNHIGATYIKDQKEASCYEEGYTGDTYCSGCNSKLVSGTVIEKNAHNPASVWSTDENYHWHACQTVGCGNKIEKSSHTGGIATCINKAVCSVCAAEYGSKDPNNHTGNTEIRNISEPKCNAEGYTGDTYCKDCSVKILSGKSIPKLSHSITEWTVTKTATTTETGEKTGRCVLCGKVFKAEIARLTSKPVESTNIEYSGMETVPKIVPDGNTVLPENVIFIANRLSPENFTAKQSELAKNVINQVINNASAVLGSGKKANGAQVICAFDISSKIQNYDTVSGDKLGDEDYKVDGSVNVTVQAPQMKNLKNPYLVYVKNDGSYEAVKFTDNGDGTISFIATGSEHNYLVLDIDVFKTDEKRTDGTKSPNMADDEGSCALPIIMFALSVTGLSVLIIDKKKRIK